MKGGEALHSDQAYGIRPSTTRRARSIDSFLLFVDNTIVIILK